MRFPVLTATGFFDDDQPGALRYYRNPHPQPAPTLAAGEALPRDRPRDHGGTQSPVKDVEGLSSFPMPAVIDMKKLHLDWYDGRSARRSCRRFSATGLPTS